jgi:lysylphosphatidylglycerol synthetase-like protein (DUF2156 family)
MWQSILGVGIFFVILLFGLVQYFKHADITSLQDFSIAGFFKNFFNFGAGNGLSAYELSLFFTIFVMLQFWNMFNAKAFMTGKSAFANIGKSGGFLLIAGVIIVGQWVIVTFCFADVELEYKNLNTNNISAALPIYTFLSGKIVFFRGLYGNFSYLCTRFQKTNNLKYVTDCNTRQRTFE